MSARFDPGSPSPNMTDPQTKAAYATHASRFAAQPPREPDRGIHKYFAGAFPAGSKVLDVGAGVGHDLNFLVRDGYAAYGIEPVDELRRELESLYPELTGRVVGAELPDDLLQCLPSDAPFDGILCSAVLQHLPRARLLDAIYALRRALRPGGRLLLSIPESRDDLDDQGRDPLGRFFSQLAPGELQLLCERVGFRSLGRWVEPDSLGRGGVQWSVQLFELIGGAESGTPRPLDQIEAVLRRDRKVATYKLALLRAFAEIATTQGRSVVWRSDSTVAVPIDAVAECWIHYYWSLFDSEVFLPQMNGEMAKQEHGLAFATQLDRLRNAYRQQGGLSAYQLAARRGDLSAVRRDAMTKVGHAIRVGPVQHAGVTTAGRPLFSYDAQTRSILVTEALWREIALMGHWIRDSLLVRWAMECGRLAESGEGAATQRVTEAALCILLTPSLDGRDTDVARGVFQKLPPSERPCVWTGKSTHSRFDVDHAIPYALWGNNSLWNLFPALPSVNSKKSDRLPTHDLLKKRRAVIQNYWEFLRAEEPTAFAYDLTRLCGATTGTNDLDTAFDALCESVEITALQRGCLRWEP